MRQAVGDHLTQVEALALMARRALIVERLLTLIELRGKDRVVL